MLNQVILVGRLEKQDKNTWYIKPTDEQIIPIEVFNVPKDLPTNLGIVGIKGHLIVSNGLIKVIADKLTFIAPKKEEPDDDSQTE